MTKPAEKLPPADLMTVGQLAARLGISRGSAYAAVNRGDVPGVKRVGHLILIHKPTVERWLASDMPKEAARG